MANALALYEKLRTADLPDLQARAIAEAVGDALDGQASRQEKALAAKVDGGRFEADMHQIETSLAQHFDASLLTLKAELNAQKAELSAKIAEGQSETLRWVFLFWIGQVAATVAIVMAVVKALK
jgi:hypothetical protein